MEGYKLNDRRYLRDIKKAEKFFEKNFPKRVYEKFKALTPKDTGNAKRKTKLKRTNEGHVIIGDYPYSGVLDQGLFPNPPKKGTGKTTGGYSTQATKGMSEPTLTYADRIANDFLRRL